MQQGATNRKQLAVEFGKRLFRLRSQRSLSQEALGALIGKDGTQINKWEKGVNLPRADSIKLLAEALGVRTQVLWLGTLYGVESDTAAAHQTDVAYSDRHPEVDELDGLLAIESYLENQLRMVRTRIDFYRADHNPGVDQ